MWAAHMRRVKIRPVGNELAKLLKRDKCEKPDVVDEEAAIVTATLDMDRLMVLADSDSDEEGSIYICIYST